MTSCPIHIQTCYHCVSQLSSDSLASTLCNWSPLGELLSSTLRCASWGLQTSWPLMSFLFYHFQQDNFAISDPTYTPYVARRHSLRPGGYPSRAKRWPSLCTCHLFYTRSTLLDGYIHLMSTSLRPRKDYLRSLVLTQRQQEAGHSSLCGK